MARRLGGVQSCVLKFCWRITQLGRRLADAAQFIGDNPHDLVGDNVTRGLHHANEMQHKSTVRTPRIRKIFQKPSWSRKPSPERSV